MDSSSVIETSKLTKYYGKQVGVMDLDLAVHEGEVFGYLGPNGAGKSTTIKLLLNFINPTGGSMTVFGKDPQKQSTSILGDIGYIPGEIHMYDTLSGKDHLKFQASLQSGVDWKYVKKLATRLQVDLNKPIRSLSHGNKQKIAIIAAFMHEPKLLILDEPTTGLDPLIQREFYDLVSEVNQAGSTFFISSHVLPEIERMCHRVGILKEGRLMVTEEIETLKKRAVRSLEIQFTKEVKASDLQGIKGIRELQVEENIAHCKVEGSLDPLIKKISKYEVLNLITQEADLEQVFLDYYKKDKNVA
ncbi:MAG: ABC transporter ATP-binding protein [bacterium]|nr:ABC transporter ATP-binding protein [bacterium]